MHSVAEIVVWAVEQFWKHHNEISSTADSRIEVALRRLLVDPDDSCAKAWAAVIVHALRFDSGMLPDLNVALLEVTCDVLGMPPESLLLQIGIVVDQGDMVAWGDAFRLTWTEASCPTLQWVLHLGFLNCQARAEICLALKGDKVSRLHMLGKDVRKLSKSAIPPILVGACRIDSVTDAALGDFSNQAIRGDRMTRMEDEDQVYAYFGGTLEDRLLVAVLDGLNSAGKYLGIPECCRMAFGNAWNEACRTFNGDVAFALVAGQRAHHGEASVAFPWQCNPYGMYMGGGALWHFPCSLDCPETIHLVDARLETLGQIDSAFADQVRTFQTRTFWLAGDRQISLVESAGNSLKVVPQH